MPKTAYKTLILLTTLMSATSAFSDEISYLFDMSLKELTQVTVSIASQNQQPIQKAPSVVDLFDQARIQRLGIQTLEELINHIPNFRSWQHSANGYQIAVSVRGYANAYRRILILVDGRRINDGFTGSALFAGQNIPVSLFERVEVIRGPGSAIYGSSAFLAVINLVTHKQQNQVALGLGNLGHQKAQIGIGQQGTWQWQFNADIHHDNGDTYKQVEDITGKKINTNDPVRHHSLQLNSQLFNWHLALLHHETDRHDFFSSGIPTNNGSNISRTRQTQAALNYETTIAKLGSINIDLYANESYSFNQFTQAASGSLPFLIANHWILGGEFEMNSIDLTIRLDQTPSEQHQLQYGLGQHIEEVGKAFSGSNYAITNDFSYLSEFTLFSKPEERVAVDTRRHSFYAHIQDQWRHTANMTTTLGLRYDKYDDVGNSLSPRIATSYNLGRWTHRLMYGRAFRAASYSEFYLQNNPRLLGNTELQPETVDTLEANTNYKTDTLYIGITAFRNDIKNLISAIPINDNQSQYHNVGRRIIEGVELEAKWQLSNQWLLELNASRNYGDIESSSPNRYYNASIGWVKGSSWQANISWHYFDKIPAMNNANSYLIPNGLLSYHASPNKQYWLKINNILNQGYQTHAYNRLIPDGLPARGREILIGLKFML